MHLGTTLLLLVYADEAKDILDKISNNSSSLTAARAEAQAIRVNSGNWAIVVSGDKIPALATRWKTNLDNLAYSPVSIYKREGFYRVLVGNYDRRQSAEEAAAGVRARTRGDAYVVALRTWCPNATSAHENDIDLTVCSAASP